MKFVARFVFHARMLERLADNANRRVLARCGAYVRKIARDFVKHRKNPDVHSEPGHPPYDHFGLKNSIIWATDSQAAYIGPRLIKGSSLNNVAHLQEFGGIVKRRIIDPSLWNGVRIGDVAPVTENNVTKEDVPAKTEQKRDPKTGRKIVWVKVRTSTQAKHASRVYRRFMKQNAPLEEVKYPPRPYMAPALEKALPRLPGLWKNAIN